MLKKIEFYVPLNDLISPDDRIIGMGPEAMRKRHSFCGYAARNRRCANRELQPFLSI